MHIQESGEMYLETILVLSQEIINVRSVDVAEHMGFSKPSVSRAISILKSGGYVTTSPEGYLLLTELGSEVANKIYERHTILSKFLMLFDVDEETACADACKIEHIISDKSFEALKKYVNEKQ